MEIGKNIKKYREIQGITLPDLALRAGVSKAFLWEIESGKSKRPGAEVLLKIADALGVTIAHLSFSQHFNGLEPPTDRPWAVNRIDTDRILADARWARGHGAEFVVVSLHWVVEYRSNPVGYQTNIA